MMDFAKLGELQRAFELPYPSVLLVIGTGVSYGASGDDRATWKGLLEDGVHQLELCGVNKDSCDAARTLLRDAFRSIPFDLDEVLRRAQSLTNELNKLGENHYAEWLTRSVGSIKAQKDRSGILDRVAGLQRDGALLLTTNYDDLLCEATGLEPVTWQEPSEILKVITRRRKGVIHIHGHWSRPSSVILGANSYSQLVQAATTQTVFRALWLTLHWLYIGCGSGGVDDPNLGALLKWAHDSNLGEGALTDYFFSTRQTIGELPNQIKQSKNTTAYEYETHEQLPDILDALHPELKFSPFERIDERSSFVRAPTESPLDNPFPSWQEYIDGVVPRFAADEAVCSRLISHGYVLALDTASVGKTTLALRIAARNEYRASPCFYFSLKRDSFLLEGGQQSPREAMSHVKRPGALIILDDAHLNPRLAIQLWLQWNEQPLGSRLLVLATSMDRLVSGPGENGLSRLQEDLSNPPISVRASSSELLAVARYVISRLRLSPRGIEPSSHILEDWHRKFGCELGAFVVSVSVRREYLVRGDHYLPETAARDWIWGRHLQHLSSKVQTNLLCLAAFGRDGSELSTPENCLPYRDAKTRSELLFSTLVRRFLRKREFHFEMREPGWSSLVCKALEPTSVGEVMIDALERDLEFCTHFANTLSENNQRHLLIGFYEYLTADSDHFVSRVQCASLDAIAWFLATAYSHGQTNLVALKVLLHRAKDAWQDTVFDGDIVSENSQIVFLARMKALAFSMLEWLELCLSNGTYLVRDPVSLSDLIQPNQ
jgi:SIR2-like domain